MCRTLCVERGAWGFLVVMATRRVLLEGLRARTLRKCVLDGEDVLASFFESIANRSKCGLIEGV